MVLTETLKKMIRKTPKLKEVLVRINQTIQALKKAPSYWSIIKEIWKERQTFIAQLTSSAPLETETDSKDINKQSQLIFIPHLLDKTPNYELVNLIKSKKYQKIAIIGNHYNKQKINSSLDKEFSNLTIYSFTSLLNREFQEFKKTNYDALILAATNEHAISLIRTILVTLRFSGNVVLQGHNFHVGPTPTIKSAKPIVVCAYPCAGTNRFIFGFEYLMNRLKWNSSVFSPFVKNIRYIHTLRPSEKADDDLIDEAFYWKIQTLDYFQWLNTHEYFSLHRMKGLDCRFVILMRDPRDIINSFYWHTINESKDKKNHIHRIIEGYCRRDVEVNYALNWPSANKIIDNYLSALNEPNFHIIRFEDMHRNDINAFKMLMLQLELCPDLLSGVNEQDFQHAAYLGSFDYQTKGKLKRGQENFWRTGGEYSGISCRKGIIGDWKSSFTKEAVEHFKTLTGGKLLKLGYETDPNWGV